MIALSSDVKEKDRQKSLRAGMNAHFSKPINIDALQELIDTVLGGVESEAT